MPADAVEAVAEAVDRVQLRSFAAVHQIEPGDAGYGNEQHDHEVKHVWLLPWFDGAPVCLRRWWCRGRAIREGNRARSY